MKRFCFLLISSTFWVSVYAQNLIVLKSKIKGTITSVSPEWLNTNPALLVNNTIRKDSVFYYGQKENNQDSSLIMTQYFDSLGNLLEKDEFSIKKKGEIWKISNFSYMGDELFRKEIITLVDAKEAHGNSFRKEVFTYEYDSNGNVVTVKLYNYPNSSINTYSLITQENEYDSAGHLIKEFLKRGGGNQFLYHGYIYDHGILAQMNSYDSTGDISFSNVYRNDLKKNILRVYLDEYAPDNLRLELHYDEKKRLDQKKIYWEGGVNYGTQSYWYGIAGLVEKQVVTYDINGTQYYYKHFYSK